MSTNITSTLTVERVSGRHPVNVGHLVMGIAFLGIVGVWALIQADVVGGGDIRWLMPVPWVLAGLAGLAAIAATSGRRWSTTQVGWVAPATETAETSETSETVEVEPDQPHTDTPEENR